MPDDPHPKRKLGAVAKTIAAVAVLALLAAFIWASDRITLQGERTVYTVVCDGGAWNGTRCTTRLAPGARYTFRASHSRQEVLFWVVGSSAPSGRYTDCKVQNRGNWRCNVDGSAVTITYEMKDDRPSHGVDGRALPFHAVDKWKWWAMRYGVARFTVADG